MKLRLFLETPDQAEALRFVASGEHSRWHCLQPGQSTPVYDDGTMDIALSFDQAKAFWGDVSSMHICRQFALVYIADSVSQELVNSLRGLALYAFEGEDLDGKLPQSMLIKRISWLQEFYAEHNNSKALVCNKLDTVRTILAGAPLALSHILFCESGMNMCLGAELWAYKGEAMRGALAMAGDICATMETRAKFSLFFVQSCIAATSGNSYGFFADRYDNYMAHVDYDMWFNLIQNWQRVYGGGKCQRILELACGTAAVSSRFVQSGAEVFACDLSAQMLENAAKRPLKPHLYQASLIDPIPHRDLDLIICVFDSINYLSHPNQISKCLEQIKPALADNGLFIFDISTLLNSMENFSDECNLVRERDGMMVHEAFYESGKRHQVSRLELFQQWGAGYIHRSETHNQRVYLAGELVQLIQDANMKLRAVHSTDGKANLYPKKMQGIDHRFYRLFFVVSK